MNNNRKPYFLLSLCLISMTAIGFPFQEEKIAERIRQLEHPDAAVQKEALEALVQIGEPAVPALMENALSDPNPRFRRGKGQVSLAIQKGAWQALVQIGEPAVPALIEALSNKDRVFRVNAATVLGEIGQPAKSALIDALEHENVIARRLVPRALSLINDPEEKIVPALIQALKDEDKEVRENAIEAFLSLGELAQAAIPALIDRLDYGSPTFHIEAGFVVLVEMGDSGRLALTEALHNDRWERRFGSALAYGHAWSSTRFYRKFDYLGPLPKEVVSSLAEGLTRADEEGRDMAAFLLKSLGSCGISEANKALEGFPPLAISAGTVKDGDKDVDSKLLNTEGITFEFTNSIKNGQIIIKPFDGEPLGWEVMWKRRSVTITPPKGKELVKGTVYVIELKGVKDVVWNLLDAKITFATKE